MIKVVKPYKFQISRNHNEYQRVYY